MQELLVLGLIPGTDIQITFAIWSLLMCALLGSFFGSIAHRRNLLTHLLITMLLMQQTRIRQMRA